MTTTPREKQPAEVVRAKVLTYLSHLGGDEVPLATLADAVGVWHLPLSQMLRPLVARGRVRLRRGDDGAWLYRIGEERPEKLDVPKPIDALESRVDALEALYRRLDSRIEELEERQRNRQ